MRVFGLSLSSIFSGKKVAPPPVSQFDAAKASWEKHHSAKNLAEYLKHERDEEERRNTAFRALFLLGEEIPELQPTDRSGKELDYDKMIESLHVEIDSAISLIRETLIDNQDGVVHGFLHNIAIWKNIETWERVYEFPAEKQLLCLERVAYLRELFHHEIDADATEVAIAFFLTVLTEETTFNNKRVFFHALSCAVRTAIYRKQGRLYREELEKVRNAVLLKKPQLALHVEREISSLNVE